jgi:hypothetical protein
MLIWALNWVNFSEMFRRVQLLNQYLLKINNSNFRFDFFSSFVVNSVKSSCIKSRFSEHLDCKPTCRFMTFVNRWKFVKFGFRKKMYYLCSTNIERPYEAALSFLYLLENQLKFPLMCEKLPSRKKKLPQRKGFLKPMQDRIVLKSDGKSLYVVPRCKIFSKKCIF